MYKIEFAKPAVKFLSNLPKKDQEKIMERIKLLAENPRNEGVIKLVNVSPDTYRARQGDYRIKFHIFDDKLVVEIIDIDNRKNAYR